MANGDAGIGTVSSLLAIFNAKNQATRRADARTQASIFEDYEKEIESTFDNERIELP